MNLPILMTVLARLRTVPGWMLLSLAMNGLLFLAVLFGMRDNQPAPAQNGSVLPRASASIPSEEPASKFVPQLGDRQYLTYQQWVTLLRQEVKAAQGTTRLTVLLGDSISLWFPYELLPGRRHWLNQAISGEQSEALLKRLNALDETEVESFFLMIGVNDLIAGKSEKQVITNIEAAVTYLKEKHPNADIVVQSILPHSAERATWEGRDRLLLLPNSRIQSVNTALAQIAERHNAYYLNLYPLVANGEGALRPDLTTDGLHLNDNGYLVWRTAISMFMNTELTP